MTGGRSDRSNDSEDVGEDHDELLKSVGIVKKDVMMLNECEYVVC